jgi:hypothetical protein
MEEARGRLPRELREIMDVASDFSTRADYPIKNFGELRQALGGERGSVSLLGETYKVSELRDIVPQEYFPIESEEDLVFKVSSGYASKSRASLEPNEMGAKLDAAPHGQDPPGAVPRDHPNIGGLPFLKGRKRS